MKDCYIRYFDKNVQTINGDRIWIEYNTTDHPLTPEEAFATVGLLEAKGAVVEVRWGDQRDLIPSV